MSTPRDKADARWARTRERLLEGGREAFAANGVEATTVLEIVRYAGVSQPSFYNHFESKHELAREIASEFFRKDRQTKQLIFEQIDDPAVAIAINIGQTLSIAMTDPVIGWTLVKSETLRELVVSSSADPLVEMISAGVSKGRFCVDSAHTVALVIRGATLAVVQDMLSGTADDDASAYFQILVLRMLGLSAAESNKVVARALKHDLGTVI
ncbi:MAG: TetR/AcrR family transcriptional regulator [Gammaproteobacteria bacterium]|jgi:AcrR family transcriptional regulator|nr:TetR/AcrR family transcriptional regulator [Gammaproteobacteria bacterium]MDP6617767.1 TetR/AcrR family transcriptional regulator [Gammaproteobacteria bacterium]MDP6694153.1 TetR/AcrR family transcriptional regulator [Gammaproteobacteria bacterium]